MLLCVKLNLDEDGVSGFCQGKLAPSLPSVRHWEGQGPVLA